MSTNSLSHLEPSTQAVGPALDRLRWRPIHTRITLALGIGWMLDAFEVSIVGNVLGILQKLWDVTTEQASLLVSVWLIGIMIGALLFGYLADRFGRRVAELDHRHPRQFAVTRVGAGEDKSA